MEEFSHAGRKTEEEETIILETEAVFGKGYLLGRGRIHWA